MNRQDQPDCGCTTAREPCAEFPALVRMNYFHGQLISERDLKTEQTYFRERLRHMNRCLHGYGIVCGLGVAPSGVPVDCLDVPDPVADDQQRKLTEIEKRMEAVKTQAGQAESDAERAKLEAEYKALAAEREALLREIEESDKPVDPPTGEKPGDCSDEPRPLYVLTVGCGTAIDCHGNDIVLPHPVKIDVDQLLDKAGKRKLAAGETVTAFLRICHVECGVEPVRPFALDSCATNVQCLDSRVREDARITATLDPPKPDERCDGCCSSCKDPCLLLAAVRLEPGKPLREGDIDLSGRRPIGLYQPVTITGVSWSHGATYDAKTANTILGTKDPAGGLIIRFSREVHVSTLLPGVVDIWRVAGGRGVAGIVAAVDGEFVGLPADGFVTEVRYRDITNETVQPRDRIMVTVRGEFILDRCCRPVAAANIGGRVPALPGTPEAKSKPDRESECRYPPEGQSPWTSGHGGVFESWFYVAED